MVLIVLIFLRGGKLRSAFAFQPGSACLPLSQPEASEGRCEGSRWGREVGGWVGWGGGVFAPRTYDGALFSHGSLTFLCCAKKRHSDR